MKAKRAEPVALLYPFVSPAAEKLGLFARDIRTDVELQLRRSGIRVLRKDEMLKTIRMPALYAEVELLQAQQLTGKTLVFDLTLTLGLMLEVRLSPCEPEHTRSRQRLGRRDLSGLCPGRTSGSYEISSGTIAITSSMPGFQ